MNNPIGWRKTRLGDVLTLINGRAYKKPELLDEGIPVLRIQNLNGGERWYYSDLSLPENKYCEDGDLLFAWSASFGPYIWRGPKSIFHYHIWKIELSQELDKGFTYYLLQHITEAVKAAGRGISMVHMTKSGMEDWIVSIPPLAEQKRIAVILDQADALRRLRTRALDLLNTVGQAIFYEMFGDPATEADRWPTAPLADFAAHKDDIKCGPFGTQLLRSEFVDQGVPLWGIKQVNKFFLEPTHEFVTEEKFNLIKQYSIEPKDIVMTRKGTIGNCAVYPDNYPVGLMHSDLLRLRVDPRRHKPEFVADQLRFNRSFGHQLKLISGGAIMAGINVSRLKALHAIAPPLELQREYAERVRAVEAKTKVYFEARDTLASLFASLQHRAFRGEL